jgi:hypothetical protein
MKMTLPDRRIAPFGARKTLGRAPAEPVSRSPELVEGKRVCEVRIKEVGKDEGQGSSCKSGQRAFGNH